MRVPLNIPREDEKIYREAEKIVTHYIDEFRSRYSMHSMEEILSLVALQLGTIISKRQNMEDINPLVDKVGEMNEKIKDALEDM